VNTEPESYYFFEIAVRGVTAARRQVSLRLTTQAASERGGARYGVFKGRGRARDAFGALLRLLSALEARDASFYFPPPLVRYRPPAEYQQELPSDLVTSLKSYLNGDSGRFLEELVSRLLENVEIPRFIHHVITEDLKTLEEFYVMGPRRVRRLKRKHGIKRRPIAQDEIDDLLVLR
jgi:hypothetical protein